MTEDQLIRANYLDQVIKVIKKAINVPDISEHSTTKPYPKSHVDKETITALWLTFGDEFADILYKKLTEYKKELEEL